MCDDFSAKLEIAPTASSDLMQTLPNEIGDFRGLAKRASYILYKTLLAKRRCCWKIKLLTSKGSSLLRDYHGCPTKEGLEQVWFSTLKLGR